MAIIIKPLVTEKMTKITDKSSVDRTYKVKSKGGEERTKVATPKSLIKQISLGFIRVAKNVPRWPLPNMVSSLSPRLTSSR